jgi:hypothetical protein
MWYVMIFTFILGFLTFQLLPAQSPDTLWTKTFGGTGYDEGHCVQQTDDGGFIIVGSTASLGTGDNDIWLLKTNTLGDTFWTKTYGDSGHDEGYSVQQTNDGGYILTGGKNIREYIDGDLWIIKTSPLGDTLWTKTYGTSDFDVGYSIKQTTDGGYIISGSMSGKVCLIKTNESGDTLWTKIFGGSGSDIGVGKSVQQTINGGYIVTGWFEGYFGNGCLIKTDASGNTLWIKTFNSFTGHSVHQTSDGGYIMLGIQAAGWWCNSFLIKTNSFGDILWTKTFDTGQHDHGYSVQQTSDSGYILAGEGEFLLIKTNASGDTLWKMIKADTNNYGYGKSVRQTSDGGYILTGAINDNVWLIKTATDPMRIKKAETTVLTEYQLHQNYPNPFNPTTIITWQLPVTSPVKLTVFNITGQKVVTLLSASLHSGFHEYEWDASHLPSGIYLYRLQAGDYVETRKMVMMK